jgi:Ser/Thr protein kinase RdoA (MazF antagonist)
MHNIGILHGDLHGDNIVFNSYDNDVRIIDLDGAVYIKDVKESDIEKYNDFWDTKNWIEKRLESLDDLLWYEKCIMWNN